MMQLCLEKGEKKNMAVEKAQMETNGSSTNKKTNVRNSALLALSIF